MKKLSQKILVKSRKLIIKKILIICIKSSLTFFANDMVSHAQTYGGVIGGFGVDADVRANISRFGVASPNGGINTDDWFKYSTPAGTGTYIIDTTGSAALKAQILLNNNIAFSKHMRYPNMTIVNGRRWVSGIYARDNNSINSNFDYSAFVTSNKNVDNPTTWSFGTSNITPKNDIIDVYTHLRRRSSSMLDSLYLFAGVTTSDVTGDHHIDMEMFKDTAYINSSNHFVSAGTHVGHTTWTFDNTGHVTATGDVIFTFDYPGGVSQPEIRVFIFVSQNSFNTVTPTYFSFIAGTYVSCGGNNSGYGYAQISLPIQALGNYTGIASGDTTKAAPWGTISPNNGAWSGNYIQDQLLEFGLNLTALGIDPALYVNYGVSACDAPFTSVLFKTRTSHSFTATLTDYAGPFAIGGKQAIPADILGNTLINCYNPTTTLTADSLFSGGVYHWSTTNGHIVSSNVDTTFIVVDAGGLYKLQTSPTHECGFNNQDTISVHMDTVKANVSNLTMNNSTICLSSGVTVTVNAPLMLNGTYIYKYNLSGANVLTNQTATVTMTSHSGSLTVPAASLTNAGITTLTLVSIQNTSNGCIRSGFPPFTCTITIDPNTAGLTLSNQTVCASNAAALTVTAPYLVAGNYTFTYNLSGSNIISNSTVTVAIASGTGIMTIPSYQLTNAGTTTITLTKVKNQTSLCQKTGLSITATITVNANPNVTGMTLSSATVCSNVATNLTISAALLAAGTYTFTYNLGNPNTANGLTQSVVISGGTGILTIAAANLTNAAPTNITISSVFNPATGCSSTSSVVGVIIVLARPTATSGSNSPACNGGPINLTSGGGVSYSWTGPNSFVSSTQNPTIASAVATNAGTYNVVVTGANGCTNPSSTSVVVNNCFITLSGMVWDDANASATINGTETGTNAGSTLYAIVVNSSNVVIGTSVVASNGTYSVANIPAYTNGYKIILSTSNPAISSTFTSSPSLPTNWVNTADVAGVSNTASQGATLGLIELNTLGLAVTAQNFGIEQLPYATAATLASQVNPGGTNNVTITSSFAGTDADGSVTQIHILSFPSNVTTITIGSTTYTSGTFPVGGVTVTTGTTVTIDPINGAITVVIPFKTIDNAGKESTASANVTVPFTDIWISGKVYDDANGLTDNTVNGTLMNASGTLYMTLVNGAGTSIIAVLPVASNGVYQFTSANGVQANTDFKLVLTTNPAGSLTTALPTNWVNTGEQFPNSGGSDGTVDGILSVHVFAITLNNDCNHGIEQRPVAANTAASSQVNPGGTVSVSVSSALFTPTDADGTVTSVKITTFPTNATSITINGTTYTSGTFPVGGVTIPAVSGVPTQAISVDPIDGSVSVVISYVAIDNANFTSNNTGTVTLPFIGISLSGNVYDDANGLTNSTVDGVGTNAGGTIYANLLNGSNIVAASMAVPASGIYSFINLNAGTYMVQISTIAGTVGNAAPANSLPSNWVNTGENIGTAAGNDGTVNGSLSVTLVSANVSNANFGIEQLPYATPSSLASQVNPGGTTNVNITSSFAGTDADGSVTQIHILSFPTNVTTITIGSTTYTSGTFPVGGVTVSVGTTITIDPIDGAVTVIVPFKTIDNAGKESSSSSNVTVPFTDLALSGTFFDDANGQTDNTVNGVGTNGGGQVYLTLVNGTNIIAVVAANSNGTYSFSTINGLQINTNYTIVATTNPLGSFTSSFPSSWVAIGENLGAAAGNDGNANGVLAVSVGTTSITNANLSGDIRPTDVTATLGSQVNPGGTVSVSVGASNFNGGDADGIVTSIRITAFPSNATSITINGTTYTSGTFPVGGVTIPALSNGNPTQSISVDPLSGTVTVVIPFVTIDNAGIEAASPAFVNIPFSDMWVSGHVWEDANGLTDNWVNGTGTNVGGTLYMTLLNASGTTILSVVPVASNGFYIFTTADGIQPYTSFHFVLTTNPAGSLTTSVPPGYVNTGEKFNNQGGSDGMVNGDLIVNVISWSMNNDCNHGIELPPTPVNAIAPTQVNPGGTTNVTATSYFSATDVDGIVTKITITTFPTNVTSITINGTTYTSGTFPIAGVVVQTNATGNPTQPITVDPIDGPTTVVITFSATDDAAYSSFGTATVTIPLSDLHISGTVYNDPDGTTNNLIDGTPFNSPAGFLLYASLVNQSTGNVVNSHAVAANGNYNFNTSTGLEINTNYFVVVSNIQGIVGQPVSTVLPVGWVYTAEGMTGSGDGTPNGITAVNVVTSNIGNINFGIELVPTAYPFTEQNEINPGGTNYRSVLATDFTGTDVDGFLALTIRITSFPTNTTTLLIDTTHYSVFNFPIGGVNIPSNINGNPTNAISIDPMNGSITVDLPYVTIDNAGKESLNPAQVHLPFTDFGISGNVYNDVNGTYNGLIDGGGISTTSGQQLYANLVYNSSGNVAGSSPVNFGGTYNLSTYNGVEINTDFVVVISTIQGTPGNPVSAVYASSWINTAEGLTGPGDGNPNGRTFVAIDTVTVNGIDFGLEIVPFAYNTTLLAQTNPGGTNFIGVPAINFTGLDVDGIIDSIRITIFPTNATAIKINGITYTIGTFPVGGVNIPAGVSGNPTQAIQIDPINGSVTVDITFVTRDNAGKESPVAGIVHVPFTDLTIGGTIYNDINGTYNLLIDGTPISTTSAVQLYANLVNHSNNLVISSMPINVSGTYTFGTTEGLEINTSYDVIVSNVAGIIGNTVAITIPSAWVNTAEGLIGTGDGNNNGSTLVNVVTSSITGINFGMERRPTNNNFTGPLKANPGGANYFGIPATYFTGSDFDGGMVDTIRITAYPNLTTKISINGTVYTSATWPAGGVSIPASVLGNPTQTIKIDPSAVGSTIITISFVTRDNAGKESLITSNVVLPFGITP